MPIDEEVNTGLVVSNKNSKNNLFVITHENEEGAEAISLYKALPKVVREELENIKTIEDIEALSQKDADYHSIKNEADNNYRLSFEVPIRFKQTKMLGGYQSNNVIYSLGTRIYYKYDSNNKITNKRINFNSWNKSLGIIQGNDIPAYSKLSDMEKFYSSEQAKACMNSDDQGKIITDNSECTDHISMGSGIFTLVPYFINKEGTVNLKITNTVNGLARYNASKNNNLQYRIEVTNMGNANSSNNIITTRVPSLVQVDTKSISNYGTYNKKSNTITWNIDEIQAGEKVQLFYRAIAPESAKNKELVGNSSVKSEQVANVVQSTNTVVTLDRIVEIIKNPETGTLIHLVNTNITLPVSFVISFILILSILSFLIVRKIHIKKEKTTI